MKTKMILAALAISFAAALQAQEPQPMPLDTNVRYGRLDNGLTYYIRHNEQPKQRAEFHIAQAVGAILEEDNQNGLAHFLEHMAFNGTEHFPGKGIINYFESVGVSFGGDINAYTSLDETVYRLSNVPTYREGIIDSALLVMRDWSCGLLLLGDEIEAERGVIREEWRTGADANRRMWKEGNRLKYPGSQYAKRDVIGDTAVINNFSHEALRNYYHKWYGPDLQAIVVVGDIDVDAIEAKIKALWADVPARTNRGERTLYGYGQNDEPIVALFTDKEAQYSRITLEYKHKALPGNVRLSQQGFALSIMNQLMENVISYRFNEITSKPSASFVAAYGGYDNAATKLDDEFIMLAISKVDQEQATLKDLLTETERLKRYGITASELERAKADLLNAYENAYNDRDNQRNISLTRECIRHYLDQEPMAGIAQELQFVQQLLPMISTDIINELIHNYISDNNMIVSILGSEKAQMPTEAEVRATLNEVKNAQIDAPKEETIDQPLVKKAPKAAKIKSIVKNPSLGTTEWILSNGAKVVLKPTNFKNDEILFAAHSNGGYSHIATDDLASAAFMTEIVAQNGIGNFSSTQIQKLLTGKTADVSPSISNDSETLTGQSSVKDFETMLQLTYLYLTAPRKDDEAFEALMNLYETILANRESNPKAAFSDSVIVMQSNHDKRVVLFNKQTLDKIDQAKAIEAYKQRFNNAADFVFFFTGNINPDDKATQKAICTWIGGIKGNPKLHEEYIDNGERTPRGKVQNYFKREMTTHTASNRIVYTADMDYTLQNRITLRLIGNILSTRYLESIREREGGSYGVGVGGWLEQYPEPQAWLVMQFDTDPEKQEKLMNIIHEEINTIVENGPLPTDLAKEKEILLKGFDESIEKNDFWSNTVLYRYYIDGENYVNDYKAAVEAVTAETIQNTLKTIVEQGNVLEVVMLPE